MIEFLSLNPAAARASLTSDVVLVDGWAVIPGQQPIDLADDRVPLPDGIEGQTRKVLANLEALLAKAGMTKADVVQVRVALVDFPRLYERMNAIYRGFFEGGRLPARTCVGVTALTRGALVEMDVLARRATP
jgi:enamine deaminase RidA (YjgF/YER057c/UK114 family)